MAGNKNSGRRGKTLEEHIRDGTYSASRHGHLLDKPKLDFPPKPKTVVKANKREQSRWIRNESDERAFRSGHRFNEGLAEHVCQFFRKFLKHSKGVWAGQPFEPFDWQIEQLLYPLFGWVRKDGTRRFRQTYIEIAKKNGKSALASGVGLYGLLEEPGAEVYSLGSDKDQARVVHNEAILMVESSEILDANLKINRSSGVISCEENKSKYQALSGATHGKHGINIHFAICDELHEWKGRKVWDSIVYGARARSQPLVFVITNAGDDMDSVCYEQREYAKRVLDGKVEDDAFFTLLYAADEDDARKELDDVGRGAAEIPVARSVNPAMGTIISEQDVIRDIKRALITPTEIPNLLRLTYGVWVAATENPLLPPGRWDELAVDFTPEDMEGRPCAAGMDLGFTHDLTALSLWFPPIEDYEKNRILCWYWLPQRVADDPKNRMRAEMLQWSRDPRAQFELTPGDTTDHGYLQRRFREVCEQFDVGCMVYDPRGAEHLTQELCDGLTGPDGVELLEGTGVPRVSFGQSWGNYSEPTAKFEQWCVAGDVEHNGNLLLSWQANHCSVQEGQFGDKRPIKPGDSKDYRTVDGVQATIMALAGSLYHMDLSGGAYSDSESGAVLF